MVLNKEEFKHCPIWIKLSNLPIELWTHVGLSWFASAIGVPLQLDSRTAKMENVSFARICVEVVVDGRFPNCIAIKPCPESESISLVNVNYNWMPSRCGCCNLIGHTEAKCRSKKVIHPSSSNSVPTEFDHGYLVGLEERSTDSILDTVAQGDPCSAHIESPEIVADVGTNGVQIDEDGVPYCSSDDGGDPQRTFEDPDGAHCVQSKPPGGQDVLERYTEGVHSDGDCLVVECDVSTPDSIARLIRKYSLVDSGKIGSNNGCSCGNLEGDKLEEAHVAFQDALSSDHLASSQVVDVLVQVVNPKHSHECCPVVT